MKFRVTETVGVLLALMVPVSADAEVGPQNVETAEAASPLLVPVDSQARMPSARPGYETLLPWDEYRSPTAAARLSKWFTLAPLAGGLTLIVFADGNKGSAQTALAIGGAGSMAFGLAFGPSIGYAYSGEQAHAWGMGTLRFVGLGFGALATFYSVRGSLCEDACAHRDTGETTFLAVALLSGTIISAFYDVIRAPNAARRRNERNGLPDIDVVPTVSRLGGNTVGGIAFAGGF